MTGRPSLYDPEEHPPLARELTGNGRTLADLAKAFGVARSTIEEWQKHHPAFSVAIKLGREDACDRVERALFERATGYSWDSEKLITVSDGGGSHVERHPIKEHVPPDPAALKFFLANRRRKEWAERQQIEGGDGGPLVVKIVRTSDAPGTLAPPKMDEPGDG